MMGSPRPEQTPGERTADAERAPAEQALPFRRRIVPVLALLTLAPWAAECSWGGFAVTEFPLVVAVLGPMYGGAAILIRETARRTGGGWPAIVLLAAAFGVVQAGLVDQSLFNKGFLDDTEFAGLDADARATLVPMLGVSVQQALGYIGNHIALSICAPIAIVESFLRPERRHRPWLGRPGLAVVGVLYLLGSLLIFSDDGGRKGFLASPVQLSVAALTALALVGAALLPRWRRDRRQAPAGMPAGGPTPGAGFAARSVSGAGAANAPAPGAGPASAPAPGAGAANAPAPEAGTTNAPVPGARPEPVAARAPRPVWVGAVVLGAHLGAALFTGWLTVAVQAVAATVAVVVVVAWSRRAGWGQRHVLAAWGAGLVNAAAFAYVVPSYARTSPAEALVTDVAISVITLALLGCAFWRLSHQSPAPH
ncbi:hypothetical protein OOK41_31245 [Micromonospora sp. NBC_01655]|uniref:hypothetical protein n=1 Tax=Micromonospora sp. NBC_01655 TaxID=2975983 RepID=UPI002255E6A8|nr:hypothetical protein [Micromonospora sp. NBC_01655]MCX4474737.1 hypothetical protein [Micromonospora sp. NBC_01655]